MGKRNRRGFGSNRQRDGIAERVLRSHRVVEQTDAEAAYLARLIANRTSIVVRLLNDEEISGWIEYYDRNFIRVTRDNAPNMFIFKDQIKFIAESGQR